MLTQEIRLDLPHLLTPLPGPRATAVIHRDAQVLSPSYTRCYPLVAARGEGAIIEDVDGNRFLDFNAGIAVASTGHCHPQVVAAIERQSNRLIHMSGTDFYYENMVQLAEKLASIAPGGGAHRVYFGNSGTEATEAAMKLARYHTGRDKFIAFTGSFHGRTMGALSLTGSKVTQRKGFGPLVPGVYHAQFPDPYRRPSGVTPDDHAASCVRFIEDELFRTIVPAEEVAGIVVEPIQGEGGLPGPTHGFPRRAAALGRPARHPADLRRSPMRHGTDRQDVGRRAFRRHARHLHHRQGHRERIAAQRHDCARRNYGLAPRCSRFHVRRKSGGGGGGPWRPSSCSNRS